jgi:hypothetical protein
LFIGALNLNIVCYLELGIFYTHTMIGGQHRRCNLPGVLSPRSSKSEGGSLQGEAGTPET